MKILWHRARYIWNTMHKIPILWPILGIGHLLYFLFAMLPAMGLALIGSILMAIYYFFMTLFGFWWCRVCHKRFSFQVKHELGRTQGNSWGDPTFVKLCRECHKREVDRWGYIPARYWKW